MFVTILESLNGTTVSVMSKSIWILPFHHEVLYQQRWPIKEFDWICPQISWIVINPIVCTLIGMNG